MTLAAYIAAARAADPSLTYDRIARRGGLPLATVAAWGAGTRGARRAPARPALVRLARGLRRPLAEVLDAAGVDDRPEPVLGDRWAALGRGMTDADREVAEAVVLAFRRARGYPGPE